MSNLFGTFFVLYMLCLVIHGSVYSGKMQTIKKIKARFNKKGVNKKDARAEINRIQKQLIWMKWGTWIIYVILFSVHLYLISLIENPKDDVNINAVYLFVTVCLSLVVMNWIKGRGAIEKNERF